MLRIHFTSADLAKTRIAMAPDPLWELSLSMHALRLRSSNPLLARWKNDLTYQLRPGTALRGQVALPLAVNPPLGYFPDFLTPAEGAAGFESGVEAVLATPKQRLRREMTAFAAAHPGASRLAETVGSAGVAQLKDLASAMRRYYEAAIVPVWDRVHAAFDADRALRSRTLADGGVTALLEGLHPSVRFTADGVVEIANYISDRDVHLDGRGLLLLPSYFKRRDKPLALVDPELPPVLVYPMDWHTQVAADRRHGDLAELLGRTRAAVLEITAHGGTPSTVARRLAISPASASQHLALLGRNGLVVSTRRGNSVHYTLTPLGHKLLGGD